mmetsp:Transcript_16926/g.36622  ORF Transcript_16926/g.36622 Transcript_16926/m.36622 type:complete len:234 (+) Transcript_16926:894-1595(+)
MSSRSFSRSRRPSGRQRCMTWCALTPLFRSSGCSSTLLPTQDRATLTASWASSRAPTLTPRPPCPPGEQLTPSSTSSMRYTASLETPNPPQTRWHSTKLWTGPRSGGCVVPTPTPPWVLSWGTGRPWRHHWQAHSSLQVRPPASPSTPASRAPWRRHSGRCSRCWPWRQRPSTAGCDEEGGAAAVQAVQERYMRNSVLQAVQEKYSSAGGTGEVQQPVQQRFRSGTQTVQLTC